MGGNWYLFSREWRQDTKDGRKGLIVHGHTGPPKQQKEPRYQVTYHTFLASGSNSLIHQSFSHFNNTQSAACSFWKFCHFPITSCLHDAHMRKDTMQTLHTANHGKMGGAWEQGYSTVMEEVIWVWSIRGDCIPWALLATDSLFNAVYCIVSTFRLVKETMWWIVLHSWGAGMSNEIVPLVITTLLLELKFWNSVPRLFCL